VNSSPWKLRTLWWLVGFAVSLLVSWLLWGWIDRVRWFTGNPNLVYDRQPDWMKVTKAIIGWIPIASVPVVIGLRVYMGSPVKVFSYLLGLSAPPLALVGLLLFAPVVSDYLHRDSFNSARWRTEARSSEDSLWPPRLCMVDDLITTKLLDGLPESTVLELLGPPEEKGFPADISPEYIHYYLGPERGSVRIDSEWLVIRFDSNRKVAKHWIYRD
jgi:hypothetical protein